MAEDNKKTCSDCEYFSEGLGEKGYCKLYHHNISIPERVCSRFEKKQEKTQLPKRKACYTEITQKKSQFKYKYNRRLSYLIGIISAFVLVIALLLVDIVFAVELFPHEIPLPAKIGTLAVVLAMFILFTWQTMVLLRKHRWVFVPYLILALALILLVLIDFGNVWLTLNNWLNKIIDYIFYELHN